MARSNDPSADNRLDRTFREFYEEKRALEELFIQKLRALEEKYEVTVGDIIFDDDRITAEGLEPIADIWIQVDFKH